MPGQQLALWAYALEIEHPVKRERMEFASTPKGSAWAPFREELAALRTGARPVYLDADMLCVDKDAGLGVAEADGGDSLEARLKIALGGDVYPVHRLDVGTSGLVLFARNPRAKDALDEAIKPRAMRKYYSLRGIRRPGRTGRLRACLVSTRKRRVEVYDAMRPGAKEIVTRYAGSQKETTLLEVELSPRHAPARIRARASRSSGTTATAP